MTFRFSDPVAAQRKATATRLAAREAAFWTSTDRSGECWVWTGARQSRTGNKGGYGVIVREGRRIYAHRRAFELTTGPIPDGLFVLHRCDNPPCIRPEHLFLGTNADNIADAVAKGRTKAPRGEASPRHRLTWDQVAAIRAAYRKGHRPSTRDLARSYGMCPSGIHSIVSGRTWKERAA